MDSCSPIYGQQSLSRTKKQVLNKVAQTILQEKASEWPFPRRFIESLRSLLVELLTLDYPVNDEAAIFPVVLATCLLPMWYLRW